MTNDDFWLLAQRRVADLRPEMVAALLRTLKIIRDTLSDEQLARFIAAGELERVFRDVLTDTFLDRAVLPVRQRLRLTVDRGFRYATADLPAAGKIDGVVAIAFDHLNPRVIDAIRRLETTALDTLKGDVKDVTRAFVENALRDGRSPKVISRELRGVIGIAPNQERYVANLRRELETGRIADAARRKLLDQRYNLAKLEQLSPAARSARIDTIVASYRKSYVAFNANVNAKTATFDAYKLGQQLSWRDAIDKGVVDGDRLVKTWVHLDEQPNPRPEHAAMQGETVPFDEPFSNRQMIPGLGDFGCHCQARYHQARS